MSESTMISTFDVHTLREQFPILTSVVHGTKPLVYLDNAATTQKPRAVIDAVTTFYSKQNSNVHRASHALSAVATQLFETARLRTAEFLNAAQQEEIVFTRGTTEAINLVASSWGDRNVKRGDEILITGMEHHANIVPWQMLCARVGATLRIVPVSDDGSLDINAVTDSSSTLLTERTKLFAMVHASNTTGTVNPVKQLCALAHERGVTTLVDGAQAVAHGRVDVQDIGCDFYVFSAHKLFGPTGIGVLYGRFDVLDHMPPYQGGGSMIHHVSFEGTTFNDVPMRFEAGTPHIEGAVGMLAALEWYRGLDHEAITEHEERMLTAATTVLQTIDGMKIIGTTPGKIPVISFNVEGVHGHDIGTLLDEQGVAVRTGHHCTMPLMERFGVGSTCRASFALYNTMEEVDVFTSAVERSIRLLR